MIIGTKENLMRYFSNVLEVRFDFVPESKPCLEYKNILIELLYFAWRCKLMIFSVIRYKVYFYKYFGNCIILLEFDWLKLVSLKEKLIGYSKKWKPN